jgi:hypothetical protein
MEDSADILMVGEDAQLSQRCRGRKDDYSGHG